MFLKTEVIVYKSANDNLTVILLILQQSEVSGVD